MWRSFNDSAPDGQLMRMVMLTYETVVPLSFDSYTCQNFDIQKVYSIQFLNYMFICLCDFVLLVYTISYVLIVFRQNSDFLIILYLCMIINYWRWCTMIQFCLLIYLEDVKVGELQSIYYVHTMLYFNNLFRVTSLLEFVFLGLQG